MKILILTCFLLLINTPSSLQQFPVAPNGIVNPTNPGARCEPRSYFVDQVPPLCMDATDYPGYEYIYTDEYEPLRFGLLDHITNILFASGPKCSLSTALAICPTFLPICSNVTVPGTNQTVQIPVRTYQCRNLCERINNTCFEEVKTIFGHTDEVALQILQCYPPGLVYLYGNGTRDVFPEPAVRNPDPNLPSLDPSVTIYDIQIPGTNQTFNLNTTCFDKNIDATLFIYSQLTCPDDGLTRDTETGYCRFKCPEPLIKDEEYLALEIIITVFSILSLICLLIMSIVYCLIYPLRRYPNTLIQYQFISVIGLSAAIIFGSFFDFHEGLWCNNDGEPNEWGNGWCTLQGSAIVYFSYASVLSWLMIIIRLFLSRGILLKPRHHGSTLTLLQFDTNKRLVWKLKWAKPLLAWAKQNDKKWLVQWLTESTFQGTTSRDTSGVSNEVSSRKDENSDSCSSDSDLEQSGQKDDSNRPKYVRIHLFFWIFTFLIWIPPLIPIIIALANKQVGYGGADLWCNIHSGAAGSFRTTDSSGIQTDDNGKDNPWLLGTYIVPILCLLLIGTILVSIIVLNTIYFFIYVFVVSGCKVFKNYVSDVTREGVDTVRLFIYAICMWLINIFSLMWLIYFNSLRDEQYNKFKESIFCSFTVQSDPTNQDPGICNPDKIISPVFWGFFAVIFTGQGILISMIFLTRGEILFALWNLIRRGKCVLTRDQYRKAKQPGTTDEYTGNDDDMVYPEAEVQLKNIETSRGRKRDQDALDRATKHTNAIRKDTQHTLDSETSDGESSESSQSEDDLADQDSDSATESESSVESDQEPTGIVRIESDSD